MELMGQPLAIVTARSPCRHCVAVENLNALTVLISLLLSSLRG